MSGVAYLARILLRRFRFRIFCWTAPIVALVAVTVPSYASSYPDLASRGPLVARLRDGAATEIMYGKLPLPGTLGQLAQWEVGAYAVLLTTVMAVVLTISMTRADEDLGLTEVTATAGVRRWAITTSVAAVAAGTFGLLGMATGAVLAVQAAGSAELTVAGGLAFGGALSVTGIGVAASTLFISEVCWDAASTRVAAWSFVSVDLAIRISADLTSWHWLRWATWFGVKDLVAPYTDDRVLPVVTGLVISGLVFAATLAVHARREFGAGLLRPPHRSLRSMRVSSSTALAWRLSRSRLAIWMVPVVATAGLFGGMSHTLIDLATGDTATGALFAELSSADGVAHQYFSFASTFVVILPMIYGVHTVLNVAGDERHGLLDAQLAVGVRRAGPLLAGATVAASGAVALLAVGAGVQTMVTLVVAGQSSAHWAVAVPSTAVFGVLAAVGLATLFVGVVPRSAHVTWAVVAWSGFVQLFGDLVGLPSAARRLSLLGHGPDTVTSSFLGATGWIALAVLGALAVASAILGALSMRRRDVQIG